MRKRAGARSPTRCVDKRLPTVFLSHGSPMHADRAGPSRRPRGQRSARTLTRPRSGNDRVGALGNRRADGHRQHRSRRPSMISAALPDELYTMRYPAPGFPELAAPAMTLLKRAGITAGIDGCRGLNHGGWVPLLHMSPAGTTFRWCRSRLQPGARYRASRGARPRARAARRRRRARRRLRAHHAQPARLDGQSKTERTVAVCAGVLADWVQDTLEARRHRRARRLARAGPRGPAVRILPTSISCPCTWPGAQRAPRRARNASSAGFEAGALALDSWLFWRGLEGGGGGGGGGEIEQLELDPLGCRPRRLSPVMRCRGSRPDRLPVHTRETSRPRRA